MSPPKASWRLDDLPPGFKPVSGKRGPRGGKWNIALRMGFVDTRVAYTPEQIDWQHNGGPGDVIAVRSVK